MAPPPATEELEAESYSQSSIAAGIEDAIGQFPAPPAWLGWLTVLGVAIGLISMVKKRG